jgi:hypothetical protein
MLQQTLDKIIELDDDKTVSDQDLSKICTQVYSELANGRPMEVRAEFYKYTNMKLTVRERNNRLFVRVSDALNTAPLVVLAAAAACIISKFLDTPAPPETRRIYRDYIYDPEIRAKVKKLRQRRAAKKINGVKGRYFDLDQCFEVVNIKYFQGKISKPILTWSASRSRSRLGHYDPDLDILVVSKKLDTKSTPGYVVEYIVYHELLHHCFPGKYSNGRRVVHSTEFNEAEQKFEEFKLVQEWLKSR